MSGLNASNKLEEKLQVKTFAIRKFSSENWACGDADADGHKI